MTYVLPKDFLSSTREDYGGGIDILRRTVFCFWQMRLFWDPQDPLRRFHEAAPDWKVILAAGMLTSGAVSTDGANLKAAQEVNETKSIYYK